MDTIPEPLLIPEGVRQRGLPPPAGRQIWHAGRDGRRHGSALRWYASGQPSTLTDYVHGCRQGRYRSWYLGGQVEVSGEYDADREVGTWRRFAEDGSLQIEIPFTAGLSEGLCRSFYPGGVLAREWTAREGLEEGKVTVYLPDGTVFSTEEFRAGKRHGLRRVWLEAALIQEEHWVDGKLLHGEGSLGPQALAPPDPGVVTETPPPRLGLAATGPVPATLITGFLGAGKTTAILHLLSQKPPDERWVVYVNEFGEVGIDAAALPAGEGDDGKLMVRELAGGCACCTSNRPFVEGVAQALDSLQPDMLLLEPTGLANTGPLRASLLALESRLELGATLCLVDPRRLDDRCYIDNPAFREQMAACDVLIANRCDLASSAQIDRFREMAREFNPAHALETELGRIDIDWLTRNPLKDPQSHAQHELSAVEGRGFRFPLQTFDEDSLSDRLLELLADPLRLPSGWLRCKGVFDTQTGPRLVNADMRGEQVVLQWADAPGDHGGSRMELLLPSGSELDWETIRTLIGECPGAQRRA